MMPPTCACASCWWTAPRPTSQSSIKVATGHRPRGA
uniref:Uncharacterized protein n=1 Tax=Setaria italica TaxID=4555 RepID=K3XTI0_SETIT